MKRPSDPFPLSEVIAYLQVYRREQAREHPSLRTGQALFNGLYEIAPRRCVQLLHLRDVDPYYKDENIAAFYEWLGEWCA